MKYYNYIKKLLLVISPILLYSCSEKDYEIPEGNTSLHNDCIKRSIGPNIIGNNIEFVYAMSLGPEQGKIELAQVEASIAGSENTYLENRSFHTNLSGEDVPIEIGKPSVNDGNTTYVEFTKDTCAASLRYYYYIPEEARGKEVSFKFSAKASTGEEVNYKLGPYKISNLDMKLDIELFDGYNCYFSVADMKAYSEAEAIQNPEKIDLIYIYRLLNGVKFNHALISPSNTEYRLNMNIPTELTNKSSLWKVYGLRDRHLARLQYGIYVDDIDFEKMNFDNAPDFGIDLKKESGIWIETADKKYKAYIYINNVDNENKSMTISIKRYTIN